MEIWQAYAELLVRNVKQMEESGVKILNCLTSDPLFDNTNNKEYEWNVIKPINKLKE